MKHRLLQDRWPQAQIALQRRWLDLTLEDIEFAQWSFESLSIVLQVRYGLTREKAEEELDTFIREMT